MDPDARSSIQRLRGVGSDPLIEAVWLDQVALGSSLRNSVALGFLELIAEIFADFIHQSNEVQKF